jgi:hypothetical protein
LDKNAVPELKDAILGEINKVLRDRGVRRNATKFQI